MNKNPFPFLSLAYLILVVVGGSDASILDNFRKLGGHGSKKLTEEISPSPGPISDDFQTPDISPTLPPTTQERCSVSPTPCTDQKNLTACLIHPLTASKELSLLAQNNGESALQVNVTISGVENFFQKIQIPKLHAKEINISVNVSGSPSIVLNAGNGECIIYLRSPTPDSYILKQLPSYATRVTPIHGAYLLFSIALIIGGAWACCKSEKGERQGDGVPYQELEMGRPESLSPNGVETTEGWDEGWDDDWDETKAVKSLGGPQRGNASENGFSSKSSDRNGWGKDWDD